MKKSEKERDKEQVKNFKIIIGVLLPVVSLYTFSNTYDQYRGEEMYGALTVFIALILIGAGLIYSTQYKVIKENKRKEKIYYEERKVKSDLHEKSQKLKNLRDKDLLSESEYLAKISDLRKNEIEHQIQKTEEYSELQSLYQSNILTEEELESKLQKLRKQYDEEDIEHLSRKKAKPDYVFSGSYKNGLAKVRDEDLNYGFVDKRGNVVIDKKYEFAEDFSEELAAVRLHGKFGFIDMEGKTTIPFIYDDAASFLNGRAEVRDGKKSTKLTSLALELKVFFYDLFSLHPFLWVFFSFKIFH
jgi:hypothetical protein